MAKCARCGQEIGNSENCQYCGYQGKSKSVLDKGVRKVAGATGTVLEKGVKGAETVAREARPVVRAMARETRKGISKAKAETLKAAKKLKEKSM